MAYDALIESIRLIDGPPISGLQRLTRRRRFLPVTVDVDQDVAVTVFLRRAHGGAEWQEHTLSRTPEGWSLLGGSGWGPDSLNALMSVPTFDELGTHAEVDGGGRSRVGQTQRPASGARWVHFTRLRVSVEVSAVLVGRGRIVSRPDHGRVVVVWRDRRRMPVSILGRDGEVLQRLELSGQVQPARWPWT